MVKKLNKLPPLYLLILLFFTFYFFLAIGITYLFQLPWEIPFSFFWAKLVGVVMLAMGFNSLFLAISTLKLKRAFGKEIYKSNTESKLITNGIYARTRNPIYLSALTLFVGWFLVLQITVLLIVSVLFAIHFYFVAKWEEKELTQRFGDEYLDYQKKVSFFISLRQK